MKRDSDRRRRRCSCSRGGGLLAWYLHVQHASRDVKGSSTVEFVTTEAPPPPPPEPGIAWPTYGLRRGAPPLRDAASRSRPPFKRVWTFRAQSLVEFPPAVGYGRLFFANNAGVLFAVGAKNGKRAWKLQLAPLRRGVARARPPRRLRRPF